MKNSVIIGLSICLSACFLGSGCNSKTTIAKNAIAFDSISVTETYHMFDDETQPSCDLGIQFVFPSDYADKEVLKSLQQLFITEYFGNEYAGLTPQEAADEYKEKYLARYKSFESDYIKEKDSMGYDEDEDIPFYSFSKYIKSYIQLNEGNVLSFVVHCFEYEGGAHGATYVSAYNVDITTGKLLKSNDIFNDGDRDKITELIIQQLMVDYEVTQVEDLVNEAGFFDINSIVVSENFYAEDKGITFIYNQYEIAPYVMGTIEVFLPYDKVKSYMTKKSPLRKFAK